jgi:hypothetical protein
MQQAISEEYFYKIRLPKRLSVFENASKHFVNSSSIKSGQSVLVN